VVGLATVGTSGHAASLRREFSREQPARHEASSRHLRAERARPGCRIGLVATTHPDRLHYTGVDEADELLAREPFALLVGFALDQQVPVQTAFSGPLKLKQRLGTLEPGKIAATDPGRLQEVF